jgi:hypothetical protein
MPSALTLPINAANTIAISTILLNILSPHLVCVIIHTYINNCKNFGHKIKKEKSCFMAQVVL